VTSDQQLAANSEHPFATAQLPAADCQQLESFIHHFSVVMKSLLSVRLELNIMYKLHTV
jgi:hypothetical protein